MKSVLVLVMVIAMIGCTSTRTREITERMLMMLYITSKAKDAFAAEPTVSVFDVEVETFKGMVQLRGTTYHQSQRRIVSAIVITDTNKTL